MVVTFVLQLDACSCKWCRSWQPDRARRGGNWTEQAVNHLPGSLTLSYLTIHHPDPVIRYSVEESTSQIRLRYGHCLQSWFVVIGTKSLAPWSSVLSTTWGQQAELASWLASSRRSWVFTEGLETLTQYDRKQSLRCLHHRRIEPVWNMIWNTMGAHQ